MSLGSAVIPSAEFRKELRNRGGDSAARCYQCATCSAVCELATENGPFPRRQMLRAQWGLADELAGDPAVWLCHRCNDCTARCPRDARPGDVMAAVRSLAVERLAAPRFLGQLVGKARVTWPLLLGLPFALWAVFIHLVNGWAIPKLQEINGVETFAWDEFVPHWMIYAVILPITGWVVIAILVGASRYWKLMGKGTEREGSFIGNLIPTVLEIVFHRRFGSCGTGKRQRTGHFLLMWGYIGAFITTGVVVIALYAFGYPLPVEQTNWMKFLGNGSAVLLVLGGVALLIHRLGGGDAAGRSSAFDIFFLFVAVMVGFTGTMTELGRLYLYENMLLVQWLYVCHLSFITVLFATFPYSKFAHMVYRTLAMVHERMVK